MGAITDYMDVGQMTLYVFWIFFAGLIYYLRREDKREGYPLESDRGASRPVRIQGFPAMPSPKEFTLASGRVAFAPDPTKYERSAGLEPTAGFPGAPLRPTGNPLADGVGPASWVVRGNHPELTIEGLPMIVPMRVATDFSVAKGDPDPRGMPVLGADRAVAGTVKDLWVDRAEPQVRYLEVQLDTHSVLLPMTLARVNTLGRHVAVQTLLASQFHDVPRLSNPDQVTLAEEDRITAYYGGGSLYAEPGRQEPWL